MAGITPPDLQKALSGVEYPADSEQLRKVAENNHASKEITDRISHLGKKEFQNPAEVSKAVFTRPRPRRATCWKRRRRRGRRRTWRRGNRRAR
ncbi:DUF2795 domain-containing protein [Streptomyces sp. NPDC018347]|uniref:DUF2795 domain-containing protein n=1 Tax=Streptomyces sp. NPDC018347 TaxID=3157193 RepID=UPI00340A36A1